MYELDITLWKSLKCTLFSIEHNYCNWECYLVSDEEGNVFGDRPIGIL